MIWGSRHAAWRSSSSEEETDGLIVGTTSVDLEPAPRIQRRFAQLRVGQRSESPAHEGIALAFSADGGFRTVSRVNGHVVGERHHGLRDGVAQVIDI